MEMPQPLTKRMNEGKPVHWIPRERDVKLLGAKVDADFHEQVMTFCEEHNISFSSWMRYVLSQEMRRA